MIPGTPGGPRLETLGPSPVLVSGEGAAGPLVLCPGGPLPARRGLRGGIAGPGASSASAEARPPSSFFSLQIFRDEEATQGRDPEARGACERQRRWREACRPAGPPQKLGGCEGSRARPRAGTQGPGGWAGAGPRCQLLPGFHQGRVYLRKQFSVLRYKWV